MSLTQKMTQGKNVADCRSDFMLNLALNVNCITSVGFWSFQLRIWKLLYLIFNKVFKIAATFQGKSSFYDQKSLPTFLTFFLCPWFWNIQLISLLSWANLIKLWIVHKKYISSLYRHLQKMSTLNTFFHFKLVFSFKVFVQNFSLFA